MSLVVIFEWACRKTILCFCCCSLTPLYITRQWSVTGWSLKRFADVPSLATLITHRSAFHHTMTHQKTRIFIQPCYSVNITIISTIKTSQMSKLSIFSFLSWCLQKKPDKQNKVGTTTVNVLELRRSVAPLLKEKLIPIFGWCRVSAALQLGASFIIFFFYSAPNAFIWWQILTVGKLQFFLFVNAAKSVFSDEGFQKCSHFHAAILTT